MSRTKVSANSINHLILAILSNKILCVAVTFLFMNKLK